MLAPERQRVLPPPGSPVVPASRRPRPPGAVQGTKTWAVALPWNPGELPASLSASVVLTWEMGVPAWLITLSSEKLKRLTKNCMKLYCLKTSSSETVLDLTRFKM